ncbi:alpha/beta fold hydrolase [Hymenobacter sp. DG25A]|uniref:alpha/beta fold hydrolase n=1 Tax=Hymenobacter sp. DG25A TaxID=1385663 RepID=UPI0006C8433C|nr:alpha/beta hydrolase [Hymenobacter sp. DG25A]
MTLVFRFRLFLFCLLLPALAAAAPHGPLVNGTPTLLTSDGVQLYASISGKGIPCVFVHGGPGAWSGMPQALAGPALEDKFQMIWYDQRGSGRSQNDPRHNYSLERMVQDLEEIRLQLGVEQWVVMAHSFGGTIATAYAAKYPQHVRGLVLVECTLYLSDSMRSMIQDGMPFTTVTDRTPYLDETRPLSERWPLVIDIFNAQNTWRKLQYQTDEGFQKVEAADQGNPRTGEFGSYVFNLPEYQQDFTLLTPQLTAPVLVVTGAKDYCIGPNHYKLFRFPNQKVAEMQTGHVPFVEEPVAFQQAVAKWAKKLK